MYVYTTKRTLNTHPNHFPPPRRKLLLPDSFPCWMESLSSLVLCFDGSSKPEKCPSLNNPLLLLFRPLPVLLSPFPPRSANLDHFLVSIASVLCFLAADLFFLPADRFRRSRRLRFILIGPPLPGLLAVVVAVFFLRLLRSLAGFVLLLEEENASPFRLKQLGPARADSSGALMRESSRPLRLPA